MACTASQARRLIKGASVNLFYWAHDIDGWVIIETFRDTAPRRIIINGVIAEGGPLVRDVTPDQQIKRETYFKSKCGLSHLVCSTGA